MTVEALDLAENPSRATVTFGIDINIDGLLAATQHVCGLVWITKAVVCNSLESKVMAARSALALGQPNDARGVLGAYLNELDAQLYKSIIELRGYELLKSDALYVLSRYGLL